MERARKLGLYVDQTVAKLLYLIFLQDPTKLLPICNIWILREKFKILAFQVLWVKYISAVKRMQPLTQTLLGVPAPLKQKNLFCKQPFKMFLCINTPETKLKAYSVAVLGDMLACT